MAWNEPGNNNGNDGRDNDPWGNNNRGNKGGREQGPPDLDEVFNKLSQKLGGKFGGGKGGKGSSLGGGGSAIGFGAIAIIAVAVWFFSGFYTIGEAERGVVQRLGKFNRLVDPGLNWRPRFIDDYTSVNVQAIRSLRSSGLMLTKDENVVNVAMDIQYKVDQPYNYLYKVTNADDSLRQATDSALRAVVGDSLMDSILTSGRLSIRQSTQVTLEDIVDSYDMGIEIVAVNFEDARPPEEVKDAFDDATASREDAQRFKREAEAYQNDIIPKAKGRAERLLKEAQGYNERTVNGALGQVAQFEKLLPEYQASPEVTRNRLYLDTMEKVYSNTSKVLIDSESSGNLLYLPIDKLTEGKGSTKPRTVQETSTYGQIELEPQLNTQSNESSSRSSTTNRQGRY
ncbi:FtsH protease activity modulator HflK [Vibrio ostreicida]|uniref:Protein HflK n=1 Tax=Vibrio ostreicida TaxID=526588 RepID=A0ABT8BNR6_9VIBR|nr:FtsH protease activity modulator HflK [Vibrio ostreicida]MDN3608353.1 FtsH protease activity modulator HflK [Vibrio ostreicida]NPD10823.1 FtsH protease activity modulator HflK [Vibrio ostreicida]